jgi:hypothetical protein
MKPISLSGLALLLLIGLVNATQQAPVNAPKGILRHAVAFNFKPEVSQEMIDRILADTRRTLPTIEGVSNIVVGAQTNKACPLISSARRPKPLTRKARRANGCTKSIRNTSRMRW